MGIGNYLKALNAQHITQTGELLNVHRPAKIGGIASDRSVRFTPQRIAIVGTVESNPEGGVNAAAGNACDFICTAGADVVVNDELGPWDGSKWVVVDINGEAQNGIITLWHVLCIITGE